MGRSGESFNGMHVMITGGTRGIGLACARAFHACHARVSLCGVDPQRVAATAERFGDNESIYTQVADVRDAHACADFVRQASARLGPVQILVNNAGRVWRGPFHEYEIAAMDAEVDVNLKGVLYMTHRVLPMLLEAQSGVIVNIASGAGLHGFGGLATYCATKFAVVGFTESLAQEVTAMGIRVYALCPGAVATDMQAQVSGRVVGMEPERVADAVLRLAGSRAPIASGGYWTL